ncbi:hypothetical protein LTR96_003452 [Exophiala xenobiotica]|nr:hypothetical protein LTR41_005926 [Exophiala xenobiotica]KAK5549960.1 hypothetical protein LTR23_000251 [Chaetothyriales sp. CCFEE 6169]KAK5229840.1 hypothetical protein LTR72_001372 [Exophiala xenobiotica]KAK5234681.1 hypothetical protein LTR47_004124 [Exophiala xenobiotica]KAK5251672.1 hypothetical protein LTS06_003613 [Exophiala xenobiotica]
MMWLFKLLFLAVLGLPAMAQIPMCASEPSSSTTPYGCTVTYTPYMAPQIGPTTTIYAAIMTTYFYVVDCRYCTVTNYQNNPTPKGPFTAKTTSSMLTITQVECMPETTASTRGRARGYEETEQAQTQTLKPKELAGHALSQNVRRSGSAVTGALVDLATTMGNDISPDINLLSGPSQESFTEIMSALFALNVADSGMNLTLACQQVQTSEVRYQLLASAFAPDQVKALLCWIAANGYSFNSTRAQVISTLQAAVYGLEVASGFTNNRTEICNNLDLFYSIAGFLAINAQQYQQIVCTNTSSETSTPPSYGQPTPVVPFGTNGMNTGGPQMPWDSNATAIATGGPQSATGPWMSGNSSFPASGNSSFPGAQDVTTWGPPISYTGSVLVWPANWTQPTGTMGTGGVASDTAIGLWNETGLRARTPPSPTAKPFYPAISTPTRHSVFKRY